MPVLKELLAARKAAASLARKVESYVGMHESDEMEGLRRQERCMTDLWHRGVM